MLLFFNGSSAFGGTVIHFVRNVSGLRVGVKEGIKDVAVFSLSCFVPTFLLVFRSIWRG